MPFISLSCSTDAPPYEVAGPSGAPVVVALGGISAHRHVCANDGNPTPGWWEALAGPERALDTTRFRVVSFDYLDGGCGYDGRPARRVTTRDQADALALVLDELNVDRAHAVVGASYGGMVALAFAERYAARVERLVVISAAHEPHPMTTALRSVQRQIVELGLATGRERDALVVARSLAMITYRTAREFAQRFASVASVCGSSGACFPVESYLRHHGERFADRWRAERFLALSLSSDLHSVDPSRISTPTVIVAAEGDTIVPREQLLQLAHEIGGRRWLIDLPSVRGHDAFLTEPDALAAILTPILGGRS